MKHDDAKTIETLQELKFQRRQRAVAGLLKREHQLRDDIAKLDAQAHAADRTGTCDMQLIGADILWRAWVGRTKSTLNVELAQVLAQKELVIRDVRREFGKLSVARELAKDHAAARKQSAADLKLAQAIEQAVLRRDY